MGHPPKEREVVLPTVHLNGTSGDVLLNQRIDYRRALREALKKLREASPHPRDFPDATDRFQRALDVHHSRVRVLEALIRDITIELEAFTS
jgi:hypothetical protein